MPPVLRLNPWASEHEGALQIGGEEEDAPPKLVRLDVELSPDEWRPLDPGPFPAPAAVFVDGVRRLEVGVVQEDEGAIRFGLFGSYAAGAVSCRPERCEIVERSVQRRLVIGGGGGHYPFVEVPAGSTPLRFEGCSVDPNTEGKTLEGLQNLMRRLEGDVARRFIDADVIVFVDGPLTFLMPLQEPILGYVKKLQRTYLPNHLMTVLYALKPGQRSPAFCFGEGSHARYSWYLRLAETRGLDYSLAGVIRVEVSTGVGDDMAVRLAAMSAATLPRFASEPHREGRAPQNLYPIGALEDDLHHSLGNHLWVRRAVQSHVLEKGGVM